MEKLEVCTEFIFPIDFTAVIVYFMKGSQNKLFKKMRYFL